MQSSRRSGINPNPCPFSVYSDTSEACPIQVDPEVLDLVIEFSMLFKDEPEYTTIKGIPIDAPEWNTSPAMQFFTRFDNDEILRLMNKVDYLHAQRLIDHAVFYICRQTQNMYDKEKVAFFGLTGDQPEAEMQPIHPGWGDVNLA
uniref:Alpha,alpha-trehalase n=1 Tax=Panagrellus redivivus TaxID=6233 RepID=A0A7E4UP33_PANRE